MSEALAHDPEAEFVGYWETHLADKSDPQIDRWRAIERTQVTRARTEIVPKIAAHCAIEGARILDVGCQCGALAVALSERGARVTGLDVSERLIEGARARARGYNAAATFVCGVGEALPFASDSFDVVTLIDVVEHVQDLAKTLAECARVIAPGGVIYLHGPNRWSPRWFGRDPHYRMLGISVLPEKIGRFYVTRVRGLPSYDVSVFPVGSDVAKTLVSLGLTLRGEPQRPIQKLGRGVSLRFASMFTLVATKR
ncbi:MAG: class I SAM-dependent methyltransferase [Deltaproteobacteria bacterium]|nr:class I SAM-dependent methyltransferase [Deltaproteobacteria bacterium]